MLQKTRQSVFKGTLTITISSALGIGISILFQVVVASTFGARSEMDAYYAATTVPNLVGTVLIGSLSITLIPVFMNYVVGQTETEAWRVVSSICNLITMVLLVVSGLGILFAPALVRLTVPGFDAARLPLTVDLLRVQFPTLVFSALSGLLTGIHYSKQRFLVPALAGLAPSLVKVVFVLALGKIWGPASVAWGYLLGLAIRCGILLPIWLRKGRFYLVIDLTHPGVRQVLRLMIPWIAGAIINKANPLVARFVASDLPIGSISYLAYAEQIKLMIATLLGSGIAQSFFPVLSAIAAEENYVILGDTVRRVMLQVLYLVCPIVAILFALRVPVIQTVFERGQFSHEASLATGMALAGYSPTIITGVLGGITGRTFYAVKDTKTPVIVANIGTFVYVILAFLLSQRLSFLGIALAFSAKTIFNQCLLLWLLSKRLRSLDLAKLARVGTLILALTMGIGFVIGLLADVVQLTTMEFLPRVGALAILSVLGMVIYLGIGHYIVPGEASNIVNHVRCRAEIVARSIALHLLRLTGWEESKEHV